MIKNNKVINKVLLPKVLSLVTIIALASGASFYVAQEKVQKNVSTEKKTIGLMGLVALLVIFSGLDIYSDYKKNAKVSSLVVSKYLKQELKNHPELKHLEKVLDNPRALQNVSTIVFNSLRSSERKRVVQIIMNVRRNLRNHRKYGMWDNESLNGCKELIKNAYDQIISILQEHASVHPEFIRDIYSAVAHADMIYIMSKNPIQQHSK